MNFKLVKEVNGEVRCYGKLCKIGEVLEFTGHLEAKAMANPNYEHTEEEVTRKRGRPKKVKTKKVKNGNRSRSKKTNA